MPRPSRYAKALFHGAEKGLRLYGVRGAPPRFLFYRFNPTALMMPLSMFSSRAWSLVNSR